jgi:hypothetical protein
VSDRFAKTDQQFVARRKGEPELPAYAPLPSVFFDRFTEKLHDLEEVLMEYGHERTELVVVIPRTAMHEIGAHAGAGDNARFSGSPPPSGGFVVTTLEGVKLDDYTDYSKRR